jgi:hypothetical protein
MELKVGCLPAAATDESNGVQKNQLSGLLEMPFQTIPRPINIDAKRANRVVEIKMLVMVVPQKVRMQIIRHGTDEKGSLPADYFFTSVFRLTPARRMSCRGAALGGGIMRGAALSLRC